MRLEKSCNGHVINWIKYEKGKKCKFDLNNMYKINLKKGK